MFSIRHYVVALISCFVLAGCVSPKSFVDPSVEKLSYNDISKPASPMKLKLSVEFQRNGEHYSQADSILQASSERILRATGLIVNADSNTTGDIKIIVNNIFDTGNAVAKGMGTGLTLGLVGSTVKDAYEMTVIINTNGKTITKTAIKHAFYTAIGNTTLPNGVEVVPPNVAFDRVLEQMILKALQQMQSAGELSRTNVAPYINWDLILQS